MKFDISVLTSFEGHQITINFLNLHPDFHNVVIVNQGTDIEDFGKELNGYMTDPSSPETEPIPPNSIAM